MQYPKINTFFKRVQEGPDKGKIILDSISKNEFLVPCEWIVSEKLNGTNTRIILSEKGIEIKGKTDKAQFNPIVLRGIGEILKHITQDKIDSLLKLYEAEKIILYGETIGELVQGKEWKYNLNGREDVDLYIFDVYVMRENGKGFWLEIHQIKMVTNELGLKKVPEYGFGTIPEIKRRVKDGLVSLVDHKTRAEGVVAKTLVTVYDERGNRIMWKLKTKDFEEYIGEMYF